MDKHNRIAVLLAGDFRMWPRAAEYIFAFAEQHAVVVDYYFATWTTTQDSWCTQNKQMKEKRPVTKNDITCEFIKHNKNLINFQLVNNFNTDLINFQLVNNFNTVRYPTFYYQTFLAKLAGIMKRRHELDNNFVYDQVFEIRPDLYIFDEGANTLVTLTDFECLLDFCFKQEHFNQWPLATDLYYQANSFGNDIMAERYYYQKSIEARKVSGPTKIKHGNTEQHNHWILLDYSYARRLQSVQRTIPFHPIPIRPNFPQDDLRNYSQAQLQEYANQYYITTFEEEKLM